MDSVSRDLRALTERVTEIRVVGQEWLASIIEKHLTFQVTGLQIVSGARYPPSTFEGV